MDKKTKLFGDPALKFWIPDNRLIFQGIALDSPMFPEKRREVMGGKFSGYFFRIFLAVIAIDDTAGHTAMLQSKKASTRTFRHNTIKLHHDSTLPDDGPSLRWEFDRCCSIFMRIPSVCGEGDSNPAQLCCAVL